jgi:2-polyprenyl-3-methyl-5-hydroxy-6-metoxy-1,4-benzoquinol methylase
LIRVRPRHLLHPIGSARSLFAILTTRWAEYKIGLRRGTCNRCWCGGSLRSFKWHSSYGVCDQCGCYVNRRPPLPGELAKLYAFENYWHYRQQLKGFPTIENRSIQDQTDGRLYRWLDLVEKYGSSKGRVIEIGCAHGTLLAELKLRGYECLGVEVDEESAAWTRNHTGVEMRAGIFPGVELPACDIFMAFDVIEHSLHPDQFMLEAGRLLTPGGVAIIQTPVDRHETERPFMQWFTPIFDDVEHLFLFTFESIHKLAVTAGLEIVGEAHGVLDMDITIFRKPVG